MPKIKSYIDQNGDALDLDEAWFARSRTWPPPLVPDQRKQSVHIMLDPDVLRSFKKDGKGWQTRINATLRRVAGLEDAL